MSLDVRPVTFREACTFVEENHRHHGKTAGCKFCIGAYDGGRLAGVAICGRPVSRMLDDGLTIEINRLCTDGTKNACSLLYGACCRAAKAMGYQKAVTYILSEEPGTSLRASGFRCDGPAGGGTWNREGRKRESMNTERKTRWSRKLGGDR